MHLFSLGPWRKKNTVTGIAQVLRTLTQQWHAAKTLLVIPLVIEVKFSYVKEAVFNCTSTQKLYILTWPLPTFEKKSLNVALIFLMVKRVSFPKKPEQD